VVGPARKKEAVAHLVSACAASQRRACKVVRQPRSTQRYEPKESSEEERLRKWLNDFSQREPRAGYRTAAKHLRREGWEISDKRVQRLWREEGLKVPQKQRKKRRLGRSENGSQRQRASAPNEVWSYDFVMDRTSDGRRLKFLCVVDEFTRECLAIEVARRITALGVVAVLAALVKERGAPKHMRSDNGPEFIAGAVRRWLESQGIAALYIEPGSPWENAYCESFNSRLRDGLLNREEFASALEAKVLTAEWRRNYNERRPHSALGDLTPAEYAARWRAALVGLAPHASANTQEQ